MHFRLLVTGRIIALMTFTEHLQRYQTWLKTLDGAPAWARVVFVNAPDVQRPPFPTDITRDQLLSPEQFEEVFESYMDGRYTWINFECLGVIDGTLFLTHFVSSQGPADEPHVPRDRISVNFSGPETGSKWNAAARMRIV